MDFCQDISINDERESVTIEEKPSLQNVHVAIKYATKRKRLSHVIQSINEKRTNILCNN